MEDSLAECSSSSADRWLPSPQCPPPTTTQIPCFLSHCQHALPFCLLDWVSFLSVSVSVSLCLYLCLSLSLFPLSLSLSPPLSVFFTPAPFSSVIYSISLYPITSHSVSFTLLYFCCLLDTHTHTHTHTHSNVCTHKIRI